MAMNRSISIISSIAPAMSLAILLLFPLFVAGSSTDEVGVAVRHAEIRMSLKQTPEKLGSWVSVSDVEIPSGALNILRPNAYLSRKYQRIGPGRSLFATLMVIHCRDARDMSGHYPPVCYPRGGWEYDPSDVWNGSLERPDAMDLNYRIYKFNRIGSDGIQRTITVADSFILPRGKSTPEMSEVLKSASRARRSAEGVAQIQIYLEGDVPIESARDVVDEILEALPAPLLGALIDKGENVLSQTGEGTSHE